MPKTRDKTYWRSYRRIKTNVSRHINYVHNATQSSETYINDANITNQNALTVPNFITENFDRNNTPEHLAESPFETIGYESDTEYESSLGSYQSSDDEVPNGNLTESEEDNIDLNTLLANWASKHNITHSALRSLLQILYPFHDGLPKDPRTLLQTTNSFEISNIEGGHYHHFGIEIGIRKQLESITTENLTFQQGTLDLQINIDGLPLFKSCNTQFWPILGRIVNPFTAEPYDIGIFVGDKKPGNVQSFLERFVEEMKILEEKTVCVTRDEVQYELKISISSVICDTPARAFIKQVKGHSGYFGCDKCTQKGVWEGKMTFPEINAALRTDVQFDEMANSLHHVGQSPFMELKIGMVTQFPLDYMHLVCLGVVRRLIGFWTKGPLDTHRIAATTVRRISENLVGMRKSLPREFLRKGRPLCDVDRWKAAEFRQFLLYTGPVCLYNNVSPAVYRHFMLLFVAIYSLSSKLFYQEFCSYSNQILRMFVTDFAKLYGQDMIVYNVHGLIHLAGDVENFGPLESYSAFVFESFLGTLKRLVRKPNYPLQQVIKRLSEKCNLTELKTITASGHVKVEHRNGPLPRDKSTFLQFEEIHLPTVFLSIWQGDNCVLIGNRVVLVRNILCEDADKGKFIVYEEFLQTENFFEYPLESKKLLIFMVSDLSRVTKCCKVSEISCKCVLLPFRDVSVSIPLLHTL